MSNNSDFERFNITADEGQPNDGTTSEATHASAADTVANEAAGSAHSAAAQAANAAAAAQDGVYHYTASELSGYGTNSTHSSESATPGTNAQGSYGAGESQHNAQSTYGAGESQHNAQSTYGGTQATVNAASSATGAGYQSPYGNTYSDAGKAPVYSHMFSDGKTIAAKKEKKRMSSGMTIFLCALFALVFGFGGAALAMNVLPGAAGSSGSVLYQSVDRTGTSDDGPSSRASVVDMTKDSVVEITTETRATSSVFGQYVTQGAGSGVIVTTDGYIVTNNHVVSGASNVKVVFNGNQYSAEIIGTDSTSDLAVIKIEETGLTPAVFGSSDSVRVGDSVIAIGNPLGSLGGSVTDGIISALEREIEVESQVMSLIQTNADVNPGNSGGGLFNMNGELIGIINAKSSSSSASGTTIEGIGFAIPGDTVKSVVTAIIENGYVTGRVVLGIQVIHVNSAETAAEYGVERFGVYIVSVDEGRGAEKAGLMAGDYILSIEDKLIEKTSDVTSLLKDHTTGDTITVQVIRNGDLMTFEVELHEKTN